MKTQTFLVLLLFVLGTITGVFFWQTRSDTKKSDLAYLHNNPSSQAIQKTSPFPSKTEVKLFSPEKPQHDISEPQVPTLSSMIDIYSDYDPVKLSEALTEIEEEIARNNWIERANQNSLSDQERENLRTLLRSANAIKIVKAKRFLEMQS